MASLGLYDSGVGGFSILKHVQSMIIPGKSILYMADTEMLPLGDKPPEHIRERMEKICDWMFNQGCSLIILACNTASVTSIRHLQQEWLPLKWEAQGKNILGINVPFIEDVSLMFDDLTDSQVVVLSTMATYASGYYPEQLAKEGFVNILSIPMPGLAEAIESGNNERVEQSVKDSLEPFEDKLPKTKLIIFACTHYIYAEETILRFFPKGVAIAEPGFTVAEKLGEYLEQHSEFEFKDGDIRYVTSGDPERFEMSVKKMVGMKVKVEKLNV